MILIIKLTTNIELLKKKPPVIASRGHMSRIRANPKSKFEESRICLGVFRTSDALQENCRGRDVIILFFNLICFKLTQFCRKLDTGVPCL